jgi:hypothetical protein
VGRMTFWFGLMLVGFIIAAAAALAGHPLAIAIAALAVPASAFGSMMVVAVIGIRHENTRIREARARIAKLSQRRALLESMLDEYGAGTNSTRMVERLDHGRGGQ